MILNDSVTSDTYKKADRWILNHLVNAAYDVKDVKGNSIEYPYATNAQKPPTHRQCVGCQETRKIHSTQGTVCKVEATVEMEQTLPYVCSVCYSPNLTIEAKLQETEEADNEEHSQAQTKLFELEENRNDQNWQDDDLSNDLDAVYDQTLNSWHQSLAAIGSGINRKENPTVEPLPDVKPHDIISKERLFTSFEDDGMPPDGEGTDTFDYSNETDRAKAFENDEYKNVKLSGSEHLKEKVGTLVEEFRDIFATLLPADPAKVTPLTFTIARDSWYSPANEN
jgi:hypothetical protein